MGRSSRFQPRMGRLKCIQPITSGPTSISYDSIPTSASRGFSVEAEEAVDLSNQAFHVEKATNLWPSPRRRPAAHI